jgi:hypothetical protein
MAEEWDGPNVQGRYGEFGAHCLASRPLAAHVSVQNPAHLLETSHFNDWYFLGAGIRYRQAPKPSAGDESLMDKVCITKLLWQFGDRF